MSLDSPRLAPAPSPAPISFPGASPTVVRPHRSVWFRIGALAGVAWNLYGVVQFLQTLRSTPEHLREMGMTAEQAAVYSSYPMWMTLAFAVGIGGGLAGSVLLLAGRARAVTVFTASLLGYLVLYVGDITEGVFAALGAPQVAILTTVVAVAAALLAWSRSLARRGLLR